MPYAMRQLPPHPHLEQLRKQAKDLLENYRAGDAAATAEVHAFERSPAASAFALHDAQRILARAYGYESWAKLKAFVDGADIAHLAGAVRAGDLARARALLRSRPELALMDMAENDEHRALHYAVFRRDPAMVRLLMGAGADARQGIYPHRDATTAYAIAHDRGFNDIVAVIEEEEQHRRERNSCPNVTVSPVQDEINRAIREGRRENAKHLLAADESLVRACDRAGATPLHIAAEEGHEDLVSWLLAHGANPRKEDLRGLSPIDRAAVAAQSNFPAIARLLLAGGATPTIRAAVALADAGRIRELVCADPGLLRALNWKTGGLLTLAVNHSHLEIVNLLLDLGADVDERVLLDEVERPTVSWGGPLWHAAQNGNRDIARLLLDRGADPNANVYASGWPLDRAYNNGDEPMKQLLLDRGANPQPYTIAAAHDIDAASRMLDGAPSEGTVSELLWSAACNGCPEIVEMTLPLIAWPPSDPRWHWVLIQPLRSIGERAGDQAYFRSMALLLDRGIDPNITRRGETVLHFNAAVPQCHRPSASTLRRDADRLRGAPRHPRRNSGIHPARLGLPLGKKGTGGVSDRAWRARR